MRRGGTRCILWAIGLVMFALAPGCMKHGHHHEPTLSALSGAKPAAVRAMEEGNRLFAAHQWAAAKKEYKAAIRIQPFLAEAHYNLALTLNQLGNRDEARSHYLQAIDLEPGLREYRNVQPEAEAPAYGGGHSH